MADIIPDSAKSSSARDALNEKTSNLPSFGDVGRALNKQFGSNDPKEVGRQIDSVTPGGFALSSCNMVFQQDKTSTRLKFENRHAMLVACALM